MSALDDRTKADPTVSARLALWHASGGTGQLQPAKTLAAQAETALQDFTNALFDALEPFDRATFASVFGPALDKLQVAADTFDLLHVAIKNEAPTAAEEAARMATIAANRKQWDDLAPLRAIVKGLDRALRELRDTAFYANKALGNLDGFDTLP